MEQITKYFNAEKHESLLLVLVGHFSRNLLFNNGGSDEKFCHLSLGRDCITF